ncbi:unnamed protein product [Pseudo-nitzschia multistriata]|uniref:F5/8 type C domain-containing protein n=1 Tax=Pseudo-nitzschia multistriata TaxID=183589 RepID=A0A448ZLV0_9STRA|nr:unnamed protein product [Pseudo-nitzschia multistriata]
MGSNFKGSTGSLSSYDGRYEGNNSGDLFGEYRGYGGFSSDSQIQGVTLRAAESNSGSYTSGMNYVSSDFVVGTNHTSSLIASGSQMRRIESDHDQKRKKVRVKPHSAFQSATFMNETDLYQCMMAGSSNFVFLTSYLTPSTKATRHAKVSQAVQRHFGSPKEDGRIGSLRLEILGCVGLDRFKPEVSVYAVCGDCAFTTDIIEGTRSPMWPNSSKRATVFPLHHAYARAFIGVFDVKQQKEKEADYLCGRTS